MKLQTKNAKAFVLVIFWICSSLQVFGQRPAKIEDSRLQVETIRAPFPVEAMNAPLKAGKNDAPSRTAPLNNGIFDEAFVTTWRTDNGFIIIPAVGSGHRYYIRWRNLTRPGRGNGEATNRTGPMVIRGLTNGHTYEISIGGKFPRAIFNAPFTIPNGSDAGTYQEGYKIQTIEQWGNIAWSSMDRAFHGCINLRNNATDAPDLSRVTNMNAMFADAANFNGDLSRWNTGNVTNMRNLFSNATGFNGDISSWNTSKVTNMRAMFWGATSFNGDISGWNTGRVTDMMAMFAEAYNFNSDIGNWNTGRVTNMHSVFFDAGSFNQNLGSWDISAVNVMIDMFNYAGLDVENYDNTLIGWASQGAPPGINLGAARLSYCNSEPARHNLQRNGWSFSRDDRDCTGAFITTWQTTDTEIIIPTRDAGYHYSVSWNNLTNPGAGGGSAVGITGNHTITGLSNGDTYQVVITGDFPRIYFNNGSQRSKIRSVEQWGNITWSSMREAFRGCNNLIYNATDVPDLRAVTSLHGMFDGANSFNGDLSQWNTGEVTDMSEMFQNATSFNGNISNWNTARVTNMSYMFDGATGFNGNVTSWNTSNVTDMTAMFRGASVFNKDISPWNTTKVTTMRAMFQNASLFNSDISYKSGIEAWNTGNVVDMSYMFDGTSAFNRNISNWKTGQVTEMIATFRDAGAFNYYLSHWNLSSLNKADNMLNNCGMDLENYDKTLLGWATQTVQTGINMGAAGLTYCFGELARSTLEAKGWSINGDSRDCTGLEFITTWQTDDATIVIPTTGPGYFYNIIWKNLTNPGKSEGSAVKQTGDYTITGLSNGDTYEVAITGDFPRIYFNNGSEKHKIRSIEQWGGVSWTSMGAAFYGCSNLVYNASDVPDLSRVGDLHSMFEDATSFNGDLSQWNTSQVTDMRTMFQNAGSFNQNLGTWDVSGVTDMAGMFNYTGMETRIYDNTLIRWASQPVQPNVNLGAADLTYCKSELARTTLQGNGWTFVGDSKKCVRAFITTWRTTRDNKITIPTTGSGYNYDISWKNLTNPGQGEGEAFNQTGNYTINVSTGDLYQVEITGDFPTIYFNHGSEKWKIRSIKQWGDISWTSMSRAFLGCQNLRNNATDAPDLSRVENMDWMLASTDLFNGDLSNWNTGNVKNMTAMFTSAGNFNGDISTWNTSNVTNMSRMFQGARKFNSDLSNWDVSNVTNMSEMFASASGFNSDLSNWNTGSVTNMYRMFQNAARSINGIGNWNTGNVTNMSEMFWQARDINGDISAWNTGKVRNFHGMFYRAFSFNGDLSNWDTSSARDMSFMFGAARVFNGDIGSWDTGNVTNMRGMFSGAISFNADISSWDTGNVTDMSSMFHFSESFNGDLNNWNTSKVRNMEEMFARATIFNGDIGAWDTGNVTNMKSMFADATIFNGDIGAWDTGNVNHMDEMFSGAINFNADIGQWNTSKVWSMDKMFSGAISFNADIGRWSLDIVNSMVEMLAGATSFNQNLGAWDVPVLTDMRNMMDGCGLDINNYNKTLIGWADKTVEKYVFLGVAGLYYSHEAVAARQKLVDNYWFIEGDALAPCEIIPDLATLPDIKVACEVATLPEPGVSGCGGAITITNDVASFPITKRGMTVVTWSYTTDDGVVLKQTQNVVIDDVTAPVFDTGTLPEDIAVTPNNGSSYILADFTSGISYSDNCDGAVLTAGITQDPVAGTELPPGEHTISIMAEDMNGNTVSSSFVVSVVTLSIAKTADGEEGDVPIDVVFTISLDNGAINRSGVPVTGTISLNGTATAGSDYTEVTSFSIAPGASAAIVTIPVLDDDEVEATETIIAAIHAPSIGTINIANRHATASLIDDDEPPVVNNKPRTVSDSYLLDEDQPLSISAPGVLSNDTDADGDPISAFLVTNVQNGSLLFNADGSFEYMPDTNFHGEDRFSYVASDGTDNSSETEVTISVNPINDAPVISTIADITVKEDEIVGPIGFTIDDPDTDIGALTLQFQTDNQAVFPNQNIILEGSGHDRSITLTPLTDQSGVTVVTLTVSDGALTTSESFTVTVNEENSTPTDIALSATSFSESEQKGFEVGTFSTIDGDAGDSHTYSLVEGGAVNSNSMFIIDGDALLTNAQFDYEKQASHTINVRTTDSRGATFEKTFTLTLTETPDLGIVSAFTPNNDRVNDTWDIENIERYPQSIITIYNVDGDRLFETVSGTREWNGTHRGKAVPTGTYYYVIRLNNRDNDVYRGEVSIIK